MQTRNRILDDFAQLMTNAMGVAQGAREEAENAARGLLERWLAERDLVSREEFEAVAQMARKAREENARLAERIAALEAAASTGRPAARKPAAKKTAEGPSPKTRGSS